MKGEGWCLPGSEAVWSGNNLPKFRRTENFSTQAEHSKPGEVSRTGQPGFPACSEDGGGHSFVTLINFYQITRCDTPDGYSICSPYSQTAAHFKSSRIFKKKLLRMFVVKGTLRDRRVEKIT